MGLQRLAAFRHPAPAVRPPVASVRATRPNKSGTVSEMDTGEVSDQPGSPGMAGGMRDDTRRADLRAVKCVSASAWEKTAALDVSVGFLFELKVVLSGSLNSMKEVIMNNSLVIHSAGLVGTLPIRTRSH